AGGDVGRYLKLHDIKVILPLVATEGVLEVPAVAMAPRAGTVVDLEGPTHPRAIPVLRFLAREIAYFPVDHHRLPRFELVGRDLLVDAETAHVRAQDRRGNLEIGAILQRGGRLAQE